MTKDTLTFKYRFRKGKRTTPFRAAVAEITPDSFTLGGEELPYASIIDTTTRDKNLIIQLANGTGLGEKTSSGQASPGVIVLAIAKGTALDIEKTIDRHSSRARAKAHQRQLELAGKAEEYRAKVCPHCQATVDLSGLDSTRNIYCRYCESVFTGHDQIVTNGDDHRHCDECNMFDRVRGFTEFYFYFLLIIYGFSSNRRFLCDDCALKMTRKMFFINFIFVLGLFPTIYNRIKIASGKKEELKKLAQANNLAKKGKFTEASEIYEQISGTFENHPGILQNQAIAAAITTEEAQMGTYLMRALKSCSNYGPTMNTMRQIQQAANKAQM